MTGSLTLTPVSQSRNPCCRVYNDANQSIPDSTVTALTFNTERFDTDGIHSTTSNTSRLTCRTAGVYHMDAHVEFASNSTGERQLLLKLNGTTFIAADSRAAINGNPTKASIPTTYQLVVGDYVEVFVFQSSGGALNVLTGDLVPAEFAMFRVA